MNVYASVLEVIKPSSPASIIDVINTMPGIEVALDLFEGIPFWVVEHSAFTYVPNL